MRYLGQDDGPEHFLSDEIDLIRRKRDRSVAGAFHDARSAKLDVRVLLCLTRESSPFGM